MKKRSARKSAATPTNGRKPGAVDLPRFPDRWMDQQTLRRYLINGVAAAEEHGHSLDDFAEAIGVGGAWLRQIINKGANIGPKTARGCGIRLARFGRPGG